MGSDNGHPNPAPAPLLSVVVPVYNEGPNIAPTLAALAANVPVPYEVLIVYDFDQDTTVPAVRELMPQHPAVRLIKNDVCRGPSGALRAGFAVARAQRVLVVMGDLCDDLTQIPLLLSLVPAKADVACPSRYCEGGRQELKPSLKVWAPRLAGRLMCWLARIPTYDPTNSFKLYSRHVLEDIELKSTISFSVTLEIVAKAHVLGYRIAEIPTVWKNRLHGKTNFKFWRSLVAYFPWMCVAMMRGRVLRVPMTFIREWFAAGSRKASTGAPDLKSRVSNLRTGPHPIPTPAYRGRGQMPVLSRTGTHD
jgi:glycosyltransferase involved in cell wall biosynthesis